jgi:glycosyltransferase involved in cell wall biosynthesis
VTARISGVVNTLDEAHNIRYALGTLLPWCDDVVVVDQHSSDGTPRIAREMGARVFDHEWTGGIAEAARALAVDQADGDWILILDADEMIPPALGQWLREQVAQDPEVDVFMLPRANIIFGRFMRHGTNWPSRRARFFRRGAVRISGRIHHGLEPRPGARLRHVPARSELAIWHFSYPDISSLVRKIDRYTTIEAQQAAERGERPPTSARRFLASAGRWFWRSYLRDRGYRDGTGGLVLAVSRAYYRFLRASKAWEQPRMAAREAAVRQVRQRILAGHGSSSDHARSAATGRPAASQEP